MVLYLLDSHLVDPLATSEVANELIELVDSEMPKRLLIDFNNVRRCSTELIATLLKVLKHTLRYNGDLRLCAMRTELWDVFRLLKLDGGVFHIYSTKAEAMEAFHALHRATAES